MTKSLPTLWKGQPITDLTREELLELINTLLRTERRTKEIIDKLWMLKAFEDEPDRAGYPDMDSAGGSDEMGKAWKEKRG